MNGVLVTSYVGKAPLKIKHANGNAGKSMHILGVSGNNTTSLGLDLKLGRASSTRKVSYFHCLSVVFKLMVAGFPKIASRNSKLLNYRRHVLIQRRLHKL